MKCLQCLNELTITNGKIICPNCQLHNRKWYYNDVELSYKYAELEKRVEALENTALKIGPFKEQS